MDTSEFVQITRSTSVKEDEFYPAINRMYEAIWGNLLPPQLLTDQLSSKLDKRLVTPPETPVPDCLTCGACCQALLCVGVRPSDTVARENYWEITVPTESGEIVVDRYLRRNEETLACTALSGTVGEKVGCTIYETRPVMCHHFDAGSDRCHAIRRAFGIEPFLGLIEMSEAAAKIRSASGNADPSQTIRNAQIRRNEETGRHSINALMHDGTLRPIHEYDPAEEEWMQFEFDGLTLSEADSLIRSRASKPSGSAE